MYVKNIQKVYEYTDFLFIILTGWATVFVIGFAALVIAGPVFGIFSFTALVIAGPVFGVYNNKKNRLINIINKIKNAAESCTPNFGWVWLKNGS